VHIQAVLGGLEIFDRVWNKGKRVSVPIFPDSYLLTLCLPTAHWYTGIWMVSQLQKPSKPMAPLHFWGKC